MNIIITGGQGFLGQRLAKALLSQQKIPIASLTLVDVIAPNASAQSPLQDSRVRCIEMDLRDEAQVAGLISPETDAIFHLAAIVSSHAEQDPDLGYAINFLATKHLLDACRQVKPSIRFIFSSSLAVFGGKLPEVIKNHTALTPQSCYGSQKAMSELLINDYSRKGFVDGLVLRLPTICIRPGKPNKAASSFVSGIMREPLHGEDAVCPVNKDLSLWISSPNTIIDNFIHALTLAPLPPRDWHVINLPGITVSVKEMLENLAHIKGEAILNHITFQFDENINNIVASWPVAIDCSQAKSLGFVSDRQFADVIEQFIHFDMK